jgi:general secretion pathway protein D
MKTIVPLLLVVLLASCTHPPPPQFTPFGTPSPSEKPAAAAAAPKAAPAPRPTPAPQPVAAPTNALAELDTNVIAPVAHPFQVREEKTAPPLAGPAVPGMTSPLQPRVPAPGITNAAAGTTNASQEVLPAGTIRFPATDLNQVLQIYAELVGRTVLRPANLGAPLITLTTQTPLTKKEAIEALDTVLGMNGITMINVGDKFVKAVPTATANTEGAPFSKLDAAQLGELGPYVTHVIQLKYTKPSELVPVLQPFAKIPNSILPIDSSQILVLRDYTENVKRMLEMIKKIDVAIPSEFVSEVIPIKYAKAEDIQQVLESLTSGGGGAVVGRSTAGTGRAPAAMGGINRPGAGGYPGTTPFGAQGNVPGMPGQPGAMGAPGGSFTERLRNIIQKASATGELQILGQTKIIADERSNSLLVFATRQDMDMIKSVVAKLDVVLAQVIIDSIIMDVQLSRGWQVGVSGLQTQKQYNQNVTGAGGYNNGQPVFDLVNFLSQMNNGSATNTFFPGSLGGGLTYWAQLGKNFDLVLRAADSDERINVIQKPRILTTHATPGSIFVGSTVPYITSTYYGGGYGGGPSSSYQQLQVGIGLTVTPYINQDGLVVMQIDETISEISGSTSITGVGDVPNTTSRQLSAEVAVRDGDAVMLGGFVRNSTDKTSSGIPILKDIPLLGPLFGSKGNSKARSELLVLMRPTVLKTPDIAAEVTAREKKGMPGVSSAEAEVNYEVKKLELKEQKEIQDLKKRTEKVEQQIRKEEAPSTNSP